MSRGSRQGVDRALVVLAALAGLAGVALAAASAHVTGPGSLETSARFLLFHAPVLLAASLLAGSGLVHPGLCRGAGLAVATGVALFSGDLAVRALAGTALFPMAAPAGGIGLMVGWAALGIAALVPGRATRPD